LPNPILYASKPDSSYSIMVANGMYLHHQKSEWVWKQIVQSELRKQGEYVYSDFGFIILGKMVEQITGMSLDKYIENRIYQRLNLTLP
jgi:CubicO group peptidase (beta-lactamase class C family)